MNRTSALLRQQLLIDPRVQGSLLRRAALYSAASGLYFLVILVFTESMSNPEEPFGVAISRCIDEAVYWAPGLMLLVPVITYDLLRVTNRFAGPVFRLRREMQRLVDGESEHPLSFRDGDYWVEIAGTFNQLRSELMQYREQARHTPPQTDTVEQTGQSEQASQVESANRLFERDSEQKASAKVLISADD